MTNHIVEGEGGEKEAGDYSCLYQKLMTRLLLYTPYNQQHTVIASAAKQSVDP
jgi:hypothetical protein